MVDVNELKATLAKVSRQVVKYQGKGLTEQDTKNALIEPVLADLGWSKTDLDLVRAEYRHTSKDNPVDYALFAKGQPVLFVEAKALDVSIDDHKYVSQVISYANVSGVNWALLTNGKSWHLYTVFAKVPAAQKRLFSVDAEDPRASAWLRWIAPQRLAGNELDIIWRQRFAERRIRRLLRQMLAQRDTDLVELLARRGGLPPKDVAAGLYHLRVNFDESEPGPLLVDDSALTDTPSKPKAKKTPVTKTSTAALKLPTPTAGTKPTVWRIGSQTWQVGRWKQVLLTTCGYLADKHGTRFAEALESDEFKGRKKRALARETGNMVAPIGVPGGYVDVHLSAKDTVRLASRLLRFCDVDLATVSYEAS